MSMADEMMREENEYLDFKGRTADPEKHGGIRAAKFSCVVEIIENMVFLSNASNFVAYFLKSMHYTPAQASNMVNNFMGTSFLLTMLGGFIGDAFFTRIKTFLIFCTMEFMGLILLTIQSHTVKLRPAENNTPSQSQAIILYIGLYAIATGVGGIKASLPAHGADQLDHSNRQLISSFFNWFFFSLCTGGLVASTVMVWIQENRCWNWSFVISTTALGFGLFIFTLGFPFYRYKIPAGSPFTRTFKVFAASVRNRKALLPRRVNHNANAEVEHANHGQSYGKFKFLDQARVDSTIKEEEVKETKTFLELLPIFASTIMMNCCLAQLQTFTVQQGATMNRALTHKFQIPTQSLSVFPLLIMLTSIPLYERIVRVFRNKYSMKDTIFHPLKRVGIGLALASVSMAVANVEARRRGAAKKEVTLSVFWLVWQYLLLGVSDMLTLGGLLEFFYSEALDSMRSICTALSWCSTSMGYFRSSVLVTISNSVSARYGQAWLGGDDLNHDRLYLFYTLVCIVNSINIMVYIYCAKKYYQVSQVL